VRRNAQRPNRHLRYDPITFPLRGLAHEVLRARRLDDRGHYRAALKSLADDDRQPV